VSWRELGSPKCESARLRTTTTAAGAVLANVTGPGPTVMDILATGKAFPNQPLCRVVHRRGGSASRGS